MEKHLKNCRICPRKCGVNRLAGNKGYCRTAHTVICARAALHFWEEPCVSGEKGSGAVFFSGCPLSCTYCQNKSIAKNEAGKEITVSRLADIFFELKDKGALNINLVTPTHYVPQIASALTIARKRGLKIPVIYNTSGYELPETLKLLEGLIDVYLPDFKYIDPLTAKLFSNAQNYPDVAKTALREMFRQTGAVQFSDEGIITKGTIVRHLVLPEHTREAKKIIRYLYETYGDDIYISIMNQYTPTEAVKNDPVLSRRLTKREYESVLNYAINIGVKNAFVQEGGTAKLSFIPDFFSYEGV